jgi:hypothetical protein
MSSQDSEGECLVSYQPLDLNIFKDNFPYVWFTDEEDEAESIPPRFLQESKEALCKRILKLELQNDDLRENNISLRRKLDKLTTSSPPPPSSSPTKET